MSKRYIVGLGLDEMNKVVFRVKDTVDGSIEVASVNKEAKMLLDKVNAMREKPKTKVAFRNTKAQTDFEAKRKEAMATKAGVKCVCCDRELSAHTVDFLNRYGVNIPQDNEWFNKPLCVTCQRKNGVDKLLMKK